MVYQQTQPSEVKPKRRFGKFFEILFDILVMAAVAGATYALFRFTIVKPENQEQNNPEVINKVPTDEGSKWLQQTINLWLANLPENAHTGVVVYDLDNNLVLGEINGDDTFTGQADSKLGLQFDKHFATANQTTAREMTEIMKTFFLHEGMDEDNYVALKESILVSGDEKRGVSAGFETGVTYNETYEQSSDDGELLAYRDSTIAEFKAQDGRSRNFVVSVIAEQFSNQEEFRKLGKAIEDSIITHFEKE